MKKAIVLVLAALLVFTLAACGNNNNTNTAANNQPAPAPANNPEEVVAEVQTIKVGATPVPHAEILKVIIPQLKEQGVELQIVDFNDYVQPNVQVFEKQLDANFFQHTPYLDQFNTDKNYDLVNAAGVHIEPFGAYSKTIKSIDELKNGAKVAIPNDPSNGGRALSLLADNGLITLKDGVGVSGTVADIVENPKELKFVELEAATLPRVLDEVDLATINTNYALEADLVPTEDALFIEGSNSPYVNILVTRPDNKDSEAIQKLVQALQSPEVKQFIEDTYKGAVVPAF